MEINPLVSILTTAYNRSLFLHETIESVISSTYSNWELIIVDDCSTDNTLEVARQYEKKDSRIKVYSNKTNLGDYRNRNRAAEIAIGKYLKYLDSDDLIYPHGLQVMVESMERYPEAGIGLQNNIKENFKPYPILYSTVEAYREHFTKDGFFLSGPSGAIIRNDAFKQNGGFSGKRHISDKELWIKISLNSPVVSFQPSLIWWRQHENQEINIERKNWESMLMHFELEKSVILSDSFPLNDKEKELALKLLEWKFKRKIFSHLKRKEFSIALKLLRKIGFTIPSLISGLQQKPQYA